MTSNWPELRIQSVRDFSEWLARSSQQRELVYRGQADSAFYLQPSIDRNVPKNSDPERRLKEEDALINSFRDKAYRFLARLEQDHLKESHDHINPMTVMQHFGAPTRLLDWTESGAIAAYFACIDEDEKEGTIWWLDKDAVVSYVRDEWDKWGFTERDANNHIIFGDRIFKRDVPEFVTMIYLRIPFSRAQAQRGLFTMGSRLGIAHDEQLESDLPKEPYGRVIIPKNLKTKVIQYLERMGIDAISLQHAGADRVGLRMVWDREHRG